jgi:F-type H+-transporting ATPase subunit epsilon
VPDTFHISLVTPERIVLDLDATYASLPAWDGQIGFAPLRAPIVLKLGDGPLQIQQSDGKTVTYFVGGGFAQMKDNRLTVLTGEAIVAGDIDALQAKLQIEAAMKTEAHTDEQFAQRQRHMDRARVMAHIAE